MTAAGREEAAVVAAQRGGALATTGVTSALMFFIGFALVTFGGALSAVSRRVTRRRAS